MEGIFSRTMLKQNLGYKIVGICMYGREGEDSRLGWRTVDL
jgi:hypothetical protein